MGAVTQQDLDWLFDHFETLEMVVENDRGFGKVSKAESDANIERARRIVDYMKSLVPN